MPKDYDSITIKDDNHRRPVDPDRVHPNIAQSLFILYNSGKITAFEILVTYSYLFNGLSLNQLRDRCLKYSDGKYSFPSKQTIHQNVIMKVTDLMNKELDVMEQAELRNRRKLLESLDESNNREPQDPNL